MSAALSLTIATYVLVRVRSLPFPGRVHTIADDITSTVGLVVCTGCWLVIAWQTIRGLF